jgi:hypothetical protein
MNTGKIQPITGQGTLSAVLGRGPNGERATGTEYNAAEFCFTPSGHWRIVRVPCSPSRCAIYWRLEYEYVV